MAGAGAAAILIHEGLHDSIVPDRLGRCNGCPLSETRPPGRLDRGMRVAVEHVRLCAKFAKITRTMFFEGHAIDNSAEGAEHASRL